MSENKGNAEIANVSILIGTGDWRIFGERLATVWKLVYGFSGCSVELCNILISHEYD